MSTVSEVLAQVFGLTATLMLCLSYTVKTKKTFLFFSLVGEVAYGLTFVFVNSIGAGLIVFLSCVQSLVYYLYEAKSKQAPKTLGFLFVAGFIILGSINFNSVFDIIPILTYSWCTFALYKKNLDSIKVMYLLPNMLLVIYDIMVMAYANALEDGIESIIILLSLVDFKKIFVKIQSHKKVATLINKNGASLRFENLKNIQSTAKMLSTSDNHFHILQRESTVKSAEICQYG